MADIINALDSQATDKALAAAQGKALSDALGALGISSIAGLADALSGKVSASAIVNDLTTGGAAVPLSAEMGKRLGARWGGNSLLLAGSVIITTPGASPNRASAAITFPTAFAVGTTPRVALATTGNVGPVSRQASVGAIDNVGMTVYAEYTTNTTSAVAIPVNYIVIGERSES